MILFLNLQNGPYKRTSNSLWKYAPLESDLIKIFLDDTPEAESLPRARVIEYVASIKRDLAIRYLEHLINDLQEMDPTFHDRLISLYLDEASDVSVKEDQQKQIREKMVKFLEQSDQYMPERVLAKLSHSVTISESFNCR